MDPRLTDVLERQRRSGFPAFAGTEAGGTIRISDQLLNQVIAATLPPHGHVRGVDVHCREGNWLDVRIALAKPAFVPPLHLELAIDRQPELPADPVLVLRLAGGAGALLKIAGAALGRAVALPPGIRLDGDRVFVDLRMLLRQRGQAALLDYVQQVCVSTEEAGLAIVLLARVP